MKDFGKYKVDHYYRLKVVNSDDKTASFGWVKVDELDLDQEMVYSYPSSSKRFSIESRNLEKTNGRSLVPKQDYVLYFEYYTGYNLEDFYKHYKTLKDFLGERGDESKEKRLLSEFLWKLGIFLLKDNRLLTNGRGYKLVSEKKDKKAEI